MENVELIRLEKGDEGTFGVLRLDGRVFCVTLEPPDRGNQPDVSCIPAGRYRCRRVRSPRFGETFEVADVPGRTHILLHAGNVAADTHGCVLLGREFGAVGGRRGVLRSADTLAAFLGRCGGLDQLDLTILEPCGGDPCPTAIA